jgi:hypothetical protein
MTEQDVLLHREIARRAYELWEQRGRPGGSSEVDWLAAEKAVRHHLSLDLQVDTLDVAGIKPGTEEPI